MELDNRILRLIAVGASFTANCQPCLQINMAKALEYGANEQEIAEAIVVGKMVRKGAASKMDDFISSLSKVNANPTDTTMIGCGCDL